MYFETRANYQTNYQVLDLGFYSVSLTEVASAGSGLGVERTHARQRHRDVWRMPIRPLYLHHASVALQDLDLMLVQRAEASAVRPYDEHVAVEQPLARVGYHCDAEVSPLLHGPLVGLVGAHQQTDPRILDHARAHAEVVRPYEVGYISGGKWYSPGLGGAALCIYEITRYTLHSIR